MEEDMVEDNGNEELVEYTFTAYEIDLDYEFDAARFFNFSRPESPLEAHQAEVWFETAGSYPPSPFVAKLVPRDEVLMENISISPKSKGMENMNLSESDSDVEVDQEISAVDMNCRDVEGIEDGTSTTLGIGSRQKFQNSSQKIPSGLTFCNNTVNINNPKTQTKWPMKPSFPRTSTFMKSTASQLAKQNRPLHTGYSRSNTSFVGKMDKISGSTCGIENQAAKRQKLEGGLLRKVVDAVQLQQNSFVHKAPKRDGFLDGNTNHTKPRITIPREPDLETAHRALRTRPKGSTEAENLTSTVRKFKALPLNRKILEGPSLLPKRSIPRLPDFQEFHLKTSERAMQQNSTVSKSTVPCHQSDKASNKSTTKKMTECGNREPARPSLMNASRLEACESSHGFKALPLNKKILTSKGDVGVFRNNKKETTVPMEFNFHTEKRFHHNPPIELFNKLSLAPETQPVSNHESKLPWSISASSKGSKENRWGCFQQGTEIKPSSKSNLTMLGGKKQIGVHEEKMEVCTASGISWSKNIR